MKSHTLLLLALSILTPQLSSPLLAQTSVSPTERYAYGANTGWLDARSGAGTLRWTSSSTRNYRIQTSADLTTWNWLPGPAIFGEDFGANSVSVPKNGPKHLFRVIALKPPAGE